MNNLKIKKMNKKKKGFTLIELIIVIAIIAILAAMAIPKLSAVRIDARVSNDLAAAKNIKTATETLISNGTITGDTTIADVSDSTNATAVAISKRVSNNGAASLTPSASSSYDFKVVVASGEVKVSVTDGTNTYQLAPENTTQKAAYAAAAQG